MTVNSHAPPPRKRSKARRWLAVLAVTALMLATGTESAFWLLIWWALMLWALAGHLDVAPHMERWAEKAYAAHEHQERVRAATPPPAWEPPARTPTRKPAPVRKKTARRKRKSPSMTRALYRGAKKGYRMGRRSKLYGWGDGDGD